MVRRTRRSGVSAIMCFASPNERNCYSHNSVEMTPFRANVLGTVLGKAVRSVGSSLVAVACCPRAGIPFGKGRGIERKTLTPDVYIAVNVIGIHDLEFLALYEFCRTVQANGNGSESRNLSCRKQEYLEL